MNGTANLPGFATESAWFSPDRRYRFSLLRVWDPSKERVCFVLMNPSVANEVDDDPTVRTCGSTATRNLQEDVR